MTEQPDLTQHVFRSVRGWLHRLYPADVILIERRADEALSANDSEADTSSADRPLWRLALATGPTWREHSGASSMLDLTIQVTKSAADVWDAQRSVGRLVANATRPIGRIPFAGYNLAFPQQPDLAYLATAAVTSHVQVAVAALGSDGTARTAPSAPVLVATGGKAIAVTPRNWPEADPIARRWAIYAAAPDEVLTLQGTVAAGGTFDLGPLVVGTTSPTNLRTDLRGLRVNGADGTVREETTEGDAAWTALVTLRLTLQVPAVWPAHLDVGMLA